MLVNIALVLVVLIIVIVLIKLEMNATFISNLFKTSNTLTFGKKRKGKDLLFQKVVNKRRKENYFTNIWEGYHYGHKGKFIDLNSVSVEPNTYEDLIKGKVTIIKREEEREKVDIYISDCGIYLPSQYNHILNKQYPSMPIYYSLSGHLYDSNIHVNYNGAFTRLWDKLREQADEFFRPLGTFRFLGCLFTKVRYFEEPQGATSNVLPFKRKFLNKEHNAQQAQFEATNGVIKDMWIVNRIRAIKYDTRFFKTVFFGREE